MNYFISDNTNKIAFINPGPKELKVVDDYTMAMEKILASNKITSYDVRGFFPNPNIDKKTLAATGGQVNRIYQIKGFNVEIQGASLYYIMYHRDAFTKRQLDIILQLELRMRGENANEAWLRNFFSSSKMFTGDIFAEGRDILCAFAEGRDNKELIEALKDTLVTEVASQVDQFGNAILISQR